MGWVGLEPVVCEMWRAVRRAGGAAPEKLMSPATSSGYYALDFMIVTVPRFARLDIYS